MRCFPEGGNSSSSISRGLFIEKEPSPGVSPVLRGEKESSELLVEEEEEEGDEKIPGRGDDPGESWIGVYCPTGENEKSGVVGEKEDGEDEGVDKKEEDEDEEEEGGENKKDEGGDKKEEEEDEEEEEEDGGVEKEGGETLKRDRLTLPWGGLTFEDLSSWWLKRGASSPKRIDLFIPSK